MNKGIRVHVGEGGYLALIDAVGDKIRHSITTAHMYNCTYMSGNNFSQESLLFKGSVSRDVQTLFFV